jgi:hypothetical protein
MPNTSLMFFIRKMLMCAWAHIMVAKTLVFKLTEYDLFQRQGLLSINNFKRHAWCVKKEFADSKKNNWWCWYTKWIWFKMKWTTASCTKSGYGLWCSHTARLGKYPSMHRYFPSPDQCGLVLHLFSMLLLLFGRLWCYTPHSWTMSRHSSSYWCHGWGCFSLERTHLL